MLRLSQQASQQVLFSSQLITKGLAAAVFTRGFQLIHPQYYLSPRVQMVLRELSSEQYIEFSLGVFVLHHCYTRSLQKLCTLLPMLDPQQLPSSLPKVDSNRADE